MSEAFTLTDAATLANILRAAQGNKQVGRLMDGVVRAGEARRFCHADGAMATNADDVRDLFLEVWSGVGQLFWPVRDLMAEVLTGEFVIDYVRPAGTYRLDGFLRLASRTGGQPR